MGKGEEIGKNLSEAIDKTYALIEHMKTHKLDLAELREVQNNLHDKYKEFAVLKYDSPEKEAALETVGGAKFDQMFAITDPPKQYGDIPQDSPLVKALEQNFKDFELKNAPHKNLQISSDAKNAGSQITELLKENPGVAIADHHSNLYIREFMEKHMADFAKAGVKTMYFEFPEDKQAIFDKYAKTGDRAELEKEFYSTGFQGYGKQVNKGLFDNIEAARNAGIRIVAMDNDTKTISIEMSDFDGNTRVNSANFAFTQRIEKDQAAHPGKYIVFTGGAHVENTDTGHGMVDDKLGIPTIGFKPSLITADRLNKADGKVDGADFYVPAGLSESSQHNLFKSEIKKAKHPDPNMQSALEQASEISSQPSSQTATTAGSQHTQHHSR